MTAQYVAAQLHHLILGTANLAYLLDSGKGDSLDRPVFVTNDCITALRAEADHLIIRGARGPWAGGAQLPYWTWLLLEMRRKVSRRSIARIDTVIVRAAEDPVVRAAVCSAILIAADTGIPLAPLVDLLFDLVNSGGP